MDFVVIISYVICIQTASSITMFAAITRFPKQQQQQQQQRCECEFDIFRFSELIEFIDTCRIAEPITEKISSPMDVNCVDKTLCYEGGHRKTKKCVHSQNRNLQMQEMAAIPCGDKTNEILWEEKRQKNNKTVVLRIKTMWVVRCDIYGACVAFGQG